MRTFGWVTEASGIPLDTLYGISKGMDFSSVFIANRVAEVAGVPIEHILRGDIVAADRCFACGRRLPT